MPLEKIIYIKNNIGLCQEMIWKIKCLLHQKKKKPIYSRYSRIQLIVRLVYCYNIILFFSIIKYVFESRR